MPTIPLWILAATLGAGMGAVMCHMTRKMISLRTGEVFSMQRLHDRGEYTAWAAGGAIGCSGIAIAAGEILLTAEIIGTFLVLASLSAVDSRIRRIPNGLLVSLLALHIAAMILSGRYDLFFPSLTGMLTGMLLFSLPSRLGLPVGLGDIKLAAVMGFCLGVIGLIQAIAVMGLMMGLYGLFLVISRKGNFKTKVAMGPYLAVGMLVALLFPLRIA